MNRRSFLSMMGFVAPAAVIIKPTYFLSPFGGWIRPETISFLYVPPIIKIYYSEQFVENLKAQTPLAMLLRNPRLPKLMEEIRSGGGQ